LLEDVSWKDWQSKYNVSVYCALMTFKINMLYTKQWKMIYCTVSAVFILKFAWFFSWLYDTNVHQRTKDLTYTGIRN